MAPDESRCNTTACLKKWRAGQKQLFHQWIPSKYSTFGDKGVEQTYHRQKTSIRKDNAKDSATTQSQGAGSASPFLTMDARVATDVAGRLQPGQTAASEVSVVKGATDGAPDRPLWGATLLPRRTGWRARRALRALGLRDL